MFASQGSSSFPCVAASLHARALTDRSDVICSHFGPAGICHVLFPQLLSILVIMAKLLVFSSGFSLSGAACIEGHESRELVMLGCEACSGVESDCCVETKSFPPETAAIRCINPAIDVCSDGFVCPLSKPSICRQYTCMNSPGDATCFNPETHACITLRLGGVLPRQSGVCHRFGCVRRRLP